jgi:hypothetical protein
VNVGEAFPADAVYIRDLYLEENSRAGGSPTINLSGGAGDISVTVNCKGYIEWLSYVYNDELENQYVYCSELIKTILGDDPNDIISTTYDKIEENLVLHATYTNENKLARTLIDDILTLGGGTDDRWTFGIYQNRKAIYAPIPTEVEYIFRNAEKTQEIETYNGFLVKPWDVLPVNGCSFLIFNKFCCQARRYEIRPKSVLRRGSKFYRARSGYNKRR